MAIGRFLVFLTVGVVLTPSFSATKCGEVPCLEITGPVAAHAAGKGKFKLGEKGKLSKEFKSAVTGPKPGPKGNGGGNKGKSEKGDPPPVQNHDMKPAIKFKPPGM